MKRRARWEGVFFVFAIGCTGNGLALNGNTKPDGLSPSIAGDGSTQIEATDLFAATALDSSINSGLNSDLAQSSSDGAIDGGTFADLAPPSEPSFATPVSYDVGNYPGAIVIGDITGDGKLDLVVDQPSSGQFTVLVGVGDGSFDLPTTTMVSGLNGIVGADVNGDSKMDLVVEGSTSTSQATTSVVELFHSKGDGTFFAPTSYLSCIDMGNGCDAGGDPGAIGVWDLNGDGRPDVAVSQSDFNGESTANASVLLGQANGLFTTMGPYRATGNAPTSPISTAIASGDFNGDHHADLVFADGKSAIDIVLGNGDGTFAAPTSVTGSVLPPSVLAAGDFDNDGKIDLISGNTSVYLSRGKNDGTFGTFELLLANTNSGLKSLAVGDFNSDGKLDVAVPNDGAGTVTILIGHDNGTFTSVIVTIGNQPTYVSIGDMNSDDHPDLVVTDTESLHVLLNTTL